MMRNSSLHYTAHTLHKPAKTLHKSAHTLHKLAQTLHKPARTLLSDEKAKNSPPFFKEEYPKGEVVTLAQFTDHMHHPLTTYAPLDNHS